MHDRLRGLEELTAAVTGMQQSAEAHDTGLRELRQAFSGVAARAAQLPGRDDIDAMVGNVGESVDGISNRLGRIETSMPSLLERLDELAAALVGHRDGIAEVSEQISALGVASPTDNSSGSVERSVAVESALMSMRQQLDALHERSDATAVEELAGRLDELHEGLFGEAGLRAQVLALQPDATAPDEDERLQDAVARAVGDSERRLSEHIDQAVLALAEALLRRRSSSRARPDSFAAALATAMPATAAPVDDTLADDDDVDDEIADQSGRADVVEATADEDTADEATADDHEVEPPTAVAASAARPAPWQTPPSAPPAAPSAAPAESARKRKWWRPGD
jgi:uncharacterized coiled-coil protein SlyX